MPDHAVAEPTYDPYTSAASAQDLYAYPPASGSDRRSHPLVFVGLGMLAMLALVAVALVAMGRSNATDAALAASRTSQSATGLPASSGPVTTAAAGSTGEKNATGNTTAGNSSTGKSTAGNTTGAGAKPPVASAPAPVIATFTTPDTIDCHNGNFQTFSAEWTTTNAVKTTISIDGPGIYKTYPAQGSDSLPFNCSSPHTFTLTAFSPSGKTVTRTITLQPRNVQVPTSGNDDDSVPAPPAPVGTIPLSANVQP